ncbi:MAG: integrase core domain-containing protein [Aeoliella sp.]
MGKGYVESFHSRFRDEFLNRELFTGLKDARRCSSVRATPHSRTAAIPNGFLLPISHL